MADADWVKMAAEAAVWAVSSLFGLFVGAWRAGRHSAKDEQRVKDDYDRKFDVLREKTRTSMAAYEEKADARNDLLIQQFKESFEGIRRQIDENKLYAEIRYLPKDDFKDWREEYRSDIREIKDSITRVSMR